jgi:hypothetical protein
MRYPAESKWYGVSICFEESFLDSFLKIPGVIFDMAMFKEMLKDNNTGLEFKISKLPELELVFYQILNCQYKGVSRSLYLESKAIEIISLFKNPGLK